MAPRLIEAFGARYIFNLWTPSFQNAQSPKTSNSQNALFQNVQFPIAELQAARNSRAAFVGGSNRVDDSSGAARLSDFLSELTNEPTLQFHELVEVGGRLRVSKRNGLKGGVGA